MKIRKPPAAVNSVTVSPANLAANTTVINGSANMNELTTAALLVYVRSFHLECHFSPQRGTETFLRSILLCEPDVKF
jgi:hypothetical protein